MGGWEDGETEAGGLTTDDTDFSDEEGGDGGWIVGLVDGWISAGGSGGRGGGPADGC